MKVNKLKVVRDNHKLGALMGERLKKFESFEPKTIEGAVSLLAKYKREAKLLAGGTDLLVLLKQRLLSPQYLVNIKRIPGLDYINSNDGEGLKVGALTTLRTIETSAVVRKKFSILAQAASKVASLQIRNIGSIGGNICQDSRCWYYNQSHDWHRAWTPCYKLGGKVCYVDKGVKGCQMRVLLSDTAPALIALDAKLKIVVGNGERVIPVKDFFKKVGNVLKPDELLTEIQIPSQPVNSCGVYLRFSPRKAIDYPVVGIAVVMGVDLGVCRDVKIVSGAVASVPFEIDKAEDLLRGKKIDSDIIDGVAQTTKDQLDTQAISFGDHSADFKTNMTRVLVKRAIEECLKSAKSCQL
jgi:xanthine dehydrogenase YagS FAD-binding subunit